MTYTGLRAFAGFRDDDSFLHLFTVSQWNVERSHWRPQSSCIEDDLGFLGGADEGVMTVGKQWGVSFINKLSQKDK